MQVAKWPDDEPGAELPRIPLSTRDHQLRRVAVLPIRPEFPARGGSARPAPRARRKMSAVISRRRDRQAAEGHGLKHHGEAADGARRGNLGT